MCKHVNIVVVSSGSPASAGNILWCLNCGAIKLEGKWRIPDETYAKHKITSQEATSQKAIRGNLPRTR